MWLLWSDLAVSSLDSQCSNPSSEHCFSSRQMPVLSRSNLFHLLLDLLRRVYCCVFRLFNLLLRVLVQLRESPDRIESNSLLLFLPSVQETQVALPTNSKDAREHKSILCSNESEGKCGNCRPELERIPHAHRNGSFDPFEDTRRRFARQDCLHTEEIGVEYWCEDGLLDANFDCDGKGFGGVVEMLA